MATLAKIHLQNGTWPSKSVSGTPNATLVERSQIDVDQFFELLRFENREKLETFSII